MLSGWSAGASGSFSSPVSGSTSGSSCCSAASASSFSSSSAGRISSKTRKSPVSWSRATRADLGGAGGLFVGRKQGVLESVHQLVGGDSLLLLERFDCVDDLFTHWEDSSFSELVDALFRRYLSPGELTSSAYSTRRSLRWWVTRSQGARSTPAG